MYEEDRKAIRKDMEEYKRVQALASKFKCPQCGGKLEYGFLHAPRGVYWDDKEHTQQIYTCEPLMSMWSWTIPRAQAWRCKDCALVIFGYGKGEARPRLGFFE